jgi:hypothetical protein
MNAASKVLAEVRATLREVNDAIDHPEWEEDPKGRIAYFLNRAFLQTRAFLEANGLLRMLDALERLHNEAKLNYLKT